MKFLSLMPLQKVNERETWVKLSFQMLIMVSFGLCGRLSHTRQHTAWHVIQIQTGKSKGQHHLTSPDEVNSE